MSGLPHVGSVATRLERDRVRRTVEEVNALLDEREQGVHRLRLDSMVAYRAPRAAGASPR